MKKIKGRNGGTLHALEKGETANPNGRPRKGISLVNEQLKEMGYKPMTKEDVAENFAQVSQLTEDEMKSLATDKSQPMIVRIVAKNLLGGKGFDVLERVINRTHGTPAQTVKGDKDSPLFPTSINIIVPDKKKKK